MQQIVDFVLEIDRLKGITRKTRPLGLDRYENSAEHSWQIALLACAMVPHAAEPVQIDRVIRMLLVHDIGEIEAGDAIFYSEEGVTERKAKEVAAVTRIFGLLPAAEGSELLALWHEFEAALSPEARFAHALDRAMPVLLNLANDGQSWRENGITYQQVVGKLEGPISRGAPALWAYLSVKLAARQDAGWFGAR